MGFISKYNTALKQVLKNPSEFFNSEDRKNSFKFSMKFAALNIIIAALILTPLLIDGSRSNTIFTLINSWSFGFRWMFGGYLSFAGFFSGASPIMGVLGLLIVSGLIHISIIILGGEKDYTETLSALGYSTAIQPVIAFYLLAMKSVRNILYLYLDSSSLLLGLYSVVNFLLVLYTLYIQIKGIESLQKLSAARASAAILLPTLALAIFIPNLILLIFLIGLHGS